MPTITTNNSWPATLPLPFVDYSGVSQVPTLRSPRTSGRLKFRKRYKLTYQTLSCTWKLNWTQWQAFKTFHETTLGNGTARFEMELRYPLNSALTTWICQFIGTIEHSPILNGIREVRTQIQLYHPNTVADKAAATGTTPFQVVSESSSGGGYVNFQVGDSSGFTNFEVQV